MDKLQPIIRQRFWILLGLCLILGIVGFFKGQGAIVAATEGREGVLKSKKDGISSGQVPNNDYKAKLGVINEEFEKRINEAKDDLFQNWSAGKMWFPESVASKIPPGYRNPDEKPELEIPPPVALIYGKGYKELIDNLWKRVEPVVPKAVPNLAGNPMGQGGFNPGLAAGLNPGLASGGFNPRMGAGRGGAMTEEEIGPVTWTQKVYIARDTVPQKFLPQTPSSSAVWDAQEDIWFTELIFDAIVRTNKAADAPTNAVVRRIDRLEFRGGDGNTEVEAADATASSDEGYATGSGGANARSAMGNMGGMGADGSMLGGTSYSAVVEFDPSEELGSDAVTAEGDSESSTGGDSSEYSSSMMAFRGGGAGGGGGLRWVKEDSAAAFRERGFYLSVIIQQARIPDLMIELTNADWPVKILRFQMGPNPYFRESLPGGGGGYGAGGYGGFAGGGDDDGRMPRGMPMGPAGGSSLGGGGSSMNAMSMMTMASGSGRGRAGMSMMGGGMGRSQGVGLNFVGTPADPFEGSLNSPDLVQLDVLGVITFFVPPSKADAETSDAPAVDTPAVDTPAATPAVDTPAATPEQPAAEGEAPAANGEVPATPAADPGTAPAADPSNPAEAPAAPTEAPASEAPATETPAPTAETPPASEAPSETPAPATPPATENSN